MSSSMKFQELTLLTRELMMKEGIKDYDLHIKGHSEKGENYLGDLTFFTVVPKDDIKKYSLVMKTAKRSEELRKKLPVGSAYKRESFMYRVVFPEMRKFLKSCGDEVLLNHVPKMFLVCDEDRRETLILENLYYSGYRVWDRKKAMDMKRVLLVLTNMGKHHAISLAMKNKLPKQFWELSKNLTNVFNEFCKTEDSDVFYETLFRHACDLLKRSGWKDLATKYEEKIQNNVVDILIRETPDEDQLVICHGDCWNNNILFKYENSGDLSGLCFIDFQLSMLDTPVKDLSFFLYTACDKSLLDNFELLLQTYYASLSDTLKELGCHFGDLFTYGELEQHWKKYAIFGLIASTLFIKIELICPEEVHELGSDANNMLNSKMKNQKLYDERILDVFIHFGKKFL